jgi:muramoyltetrapeptide carboxypeptidase
MITKDFAMADGVDLQSWNAAMTGVTEWELSLNSNVKSLVPGSAQGMLYGGCLSMLVASLGTPYEVKTNGTILFVEDIAAKPYQVDRMLMQLKLAGKLADVRGIIFGEMVDCVQQKDQGYSLQEVVMRIVGDLGVPVAYGIQSGHVTGKNITLPIGVHSALTVTDSTVKLRILEPATRPLAAASQPAKS